MVAPEERQIFLQLVGVWDPVANAQVRRLVVQPERARVAPGGAVQWSVVEPNDGSAVPDLEWSVEFKQATPLASNSKTVAGKGQGDPQGIKNSQQKTAFKYGVEVRDPNVGGSWEIDPEVIVDPEGRR